MGKKKKILEEIIVCNFPNLIRDIKKLKKLKSSKKRKAQRSGKPRQIIVKLMKTKDKEKILKVTRQKWHIIYREQ